METKTGYDKEFYKAYEKYLKEPFVRQQHDFAFSVFRPIQESIGAPSIIDLGCGKSQEYLNYHKTKGFWYTGIDQNVGNSNRVWGKVLKKGDYRDKAFLRKVINDGHNLFISLFSSELGASYEENYGFYNWLFRSFPSLKAGMVSGLYHANRKDENPMIANGNKVYQTTEAIEEPQRIGYTENRIILQVPSKFFGPHEVEVWKIFQRNQPNT